MLNDFLFSINSVLPIFILLFIGCFTVKRKMFDKSFFAQGNAVAFKLALPCNLFLNVYQTDLTEIGDMKFVLYAAAAALGSFLLLWLLAELLIKDKSLIGTIVQGGFRGNFAILGLPLLYNIIGTERSSKAVLIITFVVPIYNILSTVILTVRSNSNRRVRFGEILFSILQNPLIIGVVLGLVFSLLKPYFTLPAIANKTLSYLANLSTPLALLCLGGSMELHKGDKRLRYAVVVSLIKVLALPAVFVTLAYILGFRGDDLVILLITFSVPTAISSYTMATQMGGDEYIASTVVMLSTLLSVITQTLLIYLFKVIGIIA